MNGQFDIVIAGAGMVGLASAALLASSVHRQRLRVTVVDAGKAPEFDPGNDVELRVSAVSPATVRLFEQLDLWSSIRARRASPFVGMRVWDARFPVDDPATLVFDAADFAVPELGFIVENSLLRQALLERCRQSGVELCFDSPLHSAQTNDDRVELRLRDGAVHRPELVIAADGARSFLRGELGIAVRAWPYPQRAFVTHARPEVSHGSVAWQRFLKDGPIALLPLADGRVSIVWSTTPDRAEQALGAGDRELGNWLGEATDCVLGRLTVDGPRAAFPLRAQHAMHYVLPGLALVGDAAHNVHPLAGQGANLGFADAERLAATVEAALGDGECPGDLPTLRRYERARRGANLAMLRFTDGINRLFSRDAGLLAALRVRGMRVFNRSGPLRRKAVAVALGVSV